MKNLRNIFFLALSLLFATNISMVRADTVALAAEPKFTPEELSSLSRPSVVRIIQHVQGEVIFKPFTLDLDKLTITPAAGTPKKIPVDEYMTGSGFIVSADGYILTNSHVISDQEIKQRIIAQEAQAAIMDASLYSLDFNNETSDPEKFQAYGERINEYLSTQGTFNFQEKVVVLDPSSKKEKLVDLISEGFPIRVISVNDNFNKDFWDVALIKIDQTNLPSLPLSKASTFERGEKIGVFGFPSTAELNGKNPMEATFTQGAISAIRDSENKDFNIIQTDAKISEGSSGSPLLNESGEVIGMITYQSNKTDNTSGGDNFAFAIPIDAVQQGIKKFNVAGADISFTQGTYNAQLSRGLNLLHEAKCKSALSAFENAKNTNDKFNAGANVEVYQKKCQSLLAAGLSIDTRWDKARLMLISLDAWIWLLVASLLLFIVALSLKLFTVKKRLKKDEKEIVVLEEELKQNDLRDALEQKELVKIEEEIAQLRKRK